MTKAMSYFLNAVLTADPTIQELTAFQWLTAIISDSSSEELAENRDIVLEILQDFCKMAGLNYNSLLTESAKFAASMAE